MKSKISITSAVGLLLILMNCSSSQDPEPALTEEEKQMNRLAKTWSPGAITYGDEVITNRFNDFELTFSKNKSYTATGNLGDYDYEPFKATGSWDFKGGNLNLINRNDGVDMVVQVTDDELVLTFTMTEANGRAAGLGAYRFELTAQ